MAHYFSGEGIQKIPLLQSHGDESEVLRKLSLPTDLLIEKFLLAPMRSRDLFKKFHYLPHRGYRVLSVPFYLWEPLVTYQRHPNFIRHLFRGVKF